MRKFEFALKAAWKTGKIYFEGTPGRGKTQSLKVEAADSCDLCIFYAFSTLCLTLDSYNFKKNRNFLI